MNIKDKQWWKEFYLSEIFDIFNSKAYHKSNLKEIKKGIPYVSRTNKNNGLECVVENTNFYLNPKNTICFGAENATFFYQPYRYITGNKMYYISNANFNKYSCLFLVIVLNKCIQNSGYGYGKGLTGTRLKNVKILLPVNIKGEPDYEFMGEYIKEKETKLKEQYKEYIKSQISPKAITLNSPQEWKEFTIKDLFKDIQRGKRLVKEQQIDGEIPYISSKSVNNGIDNFIGNSQNIRKFRNCISLANSGSVGTCFYHPYEFIASDHITHLKNNYSKYTYLYMANALKKQAQNYNFNREINDIRIIQQKILLPVTPDGQPDYEYMENYIKSIEQKKLREYLSYIENN